MTTKSWSNSGNWTFFDQLFGRFWSKNEPKNVQFSKKRPKPIVAVFCFYILR